MSQHKKLSPIKELFVNILFILPITMGFFVIGILATENFLVPKIGYQQAVAAFVIVFMAPTVITGAYFAKFITYKYVVPKWKWINN